MFLNTHNEEITRYTDLHQDDGSIIISVCHCDGSGNFIENDHGTPTAKALIYNAKWFELVMLLLIINFIGNIQRYRLLRKEKWPVLVFHLAFIFIFIGGAITRYVSFEGMMLIREGKLLIRLLVISNILKYR